MSKTKNDLRHALSQGPRTELSKKFSRASGVALLFCGEGEELEVLFIKRATNPNDNWSGHLAFPGGKMEEGDATLLDACLREVHEEIGLQLSKSTYIGSLDDIQARKRGVLMEFFIEPFAFFLDSKPEVIPCSQEVAEVSWVKVSYLKDIVNQAEYVFEREGVRVSLPGIRFTNGDILWGLTYMMVQDLLKKLS